MQMMQPRPAPQHNSSAGGAAVVSLCRNSNNFESFQLCKCTVCTSLHADSSGEETQPLSSNQMLLCDKAPSPPKRSVTSSQSAAASAVK